MKRLYAVYRASCKSITNKIKLVGENVLKNRSLEQKVPSSWLWQQRIHVYS